MRTRNIDGNIKNNVKLAVDIGGTFTDVVLDNNGTLFSTKVLTTHEDPAIGFLEGVSQVLDSAKVSTTDVDLIVHGTTLATNALIERKGAKVALLCTEGFRDTIEMAYEHRFDQYDINMVRPKPLVPRNHRFAVKERISAQGKTLLELDIDQARQIVRKIKKENFDAIAIGFMHSYINSHHEERVKELIKEELPDIPISISSEVCPEIREYDRISTTVANAYVLPKMDNYLSNLKNGLEQRGFNCPLLMVMSSGTVTTLDTARKYPIRLVESGPAGGAIMAAEVALTHQKKEVLSFDMGGTTAKMCFIDEYRPQLSRSFEVARECRFLKGSGIPVKIPVIEMVEIGAGGGSIGSVNKLGVIAVGPESAGSEPGPVCYGRGGVLPTVTDADLLMGRLDPVGFAGGKFDLDQSSAADVINKEIGEKLNLAPEEAAAAVSEMVDENMANAARIHAAESGKDVSSRTMIAFGGAAPLHASRLAEKLGITEVIIPISAGVGSAVGFLKAKIAYEIVKTLYMKLEDFDSFKINNLFKEMITEATEIVRMADPNEPLEVNKIAYIRYKGQGHEIAVKLEDKYFNQSDSEAIKVQYEYEYEKQFGRIIPNLDLEIISWSVTVGFFTKNPTVRARESECIDVPIPEKIARIYDPYAMEWEDYKVFARNQIKVGSSIRGPAIIKEAETTTIVSSRFDVKINSFGNLVLNKRA